MQQHISNLRTEYEGLKLVADAFFIQEKATRLRLTELEIARREAEAKASSAYHRLQIALYPKAYSRSSEEH